MDSFDLVMTVAEATKLALALLRAQKDLADNDIMTLTLNNVKGFSDRAQIRLGVHGKRPYAWSVDYPTGEDD